MATKLLRGTTLNTLRHSPTDDSVLLWHGDAPSSPPYVPSNWYTIQKRLTMSFSDYQESVVATNKVFTIGDSGSYFEPGTPPITSPSNFLYVDQGINVSSHVIDYTAMEWKFSYLRWEYYTGTPTSFSFPYNNVGVSINSPLRSTGQFRLTMSPVNYIYYAPTSSPKSWSLSLHVLGRTFPFSIQQIRTSYPTYKTYYFSHNGLKNYINSCLDNKSYTTPYTTSLPYVSGSGDLAYPSDGYRQTSSIWEYPTGEDPIEHMGIYYPHGSSDLANRGACFDFTDFGIQGYFVQP